jgi:hypothetical protein
MLDNKTKKVCFMISLKGKSLSPEILDSIILHNKNKIEIVND